MCRFRISNWLEAVLKYSASHSIKSHRTLWVVTERCIANKQRGIFYVAVIARDIVLCLQFYWGNSELQVSLSQQAFEKYFDFLFHLSLFSISYSLFFSWNSFPFFIISSYITYPFNHYILFCLCASTHLHPSVTLSSCNNPRNAERIFIKFLIGKRRENILKFWKPVSVVGKYVLAFWPVVRRSETSSQSVFCPKSSVARCF